MGFLKTLFQPTSTELRKGSGTGIRMGTLLIAAVAVLCGAVFAMQKNQDKSSIAAKLKIVPITAEQHHHLVLENEYVRVFHVEVPPHSETLYHQHDMDYVFVTLGDSKVASERVDGKSVTLELKDGETRFTKGGFAHKAVNLSDKPFVNVTVELKKKIEEFANCTGQDRCNREIRTGAHVIGQELIEFGDARPSFGDSFQVTSYELKANTSFQKHVACTDVDCEVPYLIVPIGTLELDVDGQSRTLKIGQPYFGIVGSEYKVSSGRSSTRWVAIKFATKVGKRK